MEGADEDQAAAGGVVERAGAKQGVEEGTVAEGDAGQILDGEGQIPFFDLAPGGGKQVLLVGVEITGSGDHQGALHLAHVDAGPGISRACGYLLPLPGIGPDQ